MELYHKYRPKTLDEVLGQDKVVSAIKEMDRDRLPHALLFSGLSGTGKTTLMRILRTMLNCHDKDYYEVNAADDRGIDIIRDIKSHAGSVALRGPCKIWAMDECHQLTPQAQDSFLKLLEDPPSHVYFFLSTTDPQKLKRTIITRSTEIKLEPLSPTALLTLLGNVTEAEGKEISNEVADKIVEVSDGSARKALVFLHQIIDLTLEEDQLELLQKVDIKAQAIQIARALLKGCSWSQMAKILKGVDEDPESIRWLVLSYMTTTALGGTVDKAKRAVQIIECFEEPFYNSKKAGLVAACAAAIL